MFKSLAVAALLVLMSGSISRAEPADVLKGMAAFNWLSDPAKQKCTAVSDKLLMEFKSSKFRCNLKAKYDPHSKGNYRVCTSVPRKSEYLIYDSMRACESERQSQADNP